MSTENISLQPVTSLPFKDEGPAAGQIIEDKKAGDPNVRPRGTITFDDIHVSGVPSLNLPIGTNNDPVAVHQILEVPPATEPSSTLMGQLRYYNLADLVVLVNDSGVTVTSGSFNGFATTLPAAEASFFVNPDATFFNARENKTVRVVDIDIANLRQCNSNNKLIALPQQD